jgi:hypothetical protein
MSGRLAMKRMLNEKDGDSRGLLERTEEEIK